MVSAARAIARDTPSLNMARVYFRDGIDLVMVECFTNRLTCEGEIFWYEDDGDKWSRGNGITSRSGWATNSRKSFLINLL